MLSNHFKERQHCCNPDGSYAIQPYIDWWDTVQRVDVLDVDATHINSTGATVNVRLRFTYKDGRVVEDTIKWELIPDLSGDSWLFY